jgi:membrane protease YdiL (CAAX protease family)
MNEGHVVTAAKKPLWDQIFDFPLVAMLVAIALFIVAERATFLISQGVLPPGTLQNLIATGVVEVALLLIVYKVAIVRMGDRPHDDLRLSGAPKALAVGLAAGAALMCLVVGAAAVGDIYNIVGQGNFDEFPRDLIAAAILPAFREELFFRGILFRWIEEFGGSWAALVITSALFGLAHILNPNATWFSSFAIAMEAGVLLGGAYMLTRNLWMPMGLHAAWNFTQGFIFDVNVSGIEEHGLVEAKLSGPQLLSGGSFGLEASIIALVIATGAGVWLVVLAVRRGGSVKPWWVRRKQITDLG